MLAGGGEGPVAPFRTSTPGSPSEAQQCRHSFDPRYALLTPSPRTGPLARLDEMTELSAVRLRDAEAQLHGVPLFEATSEDAGMSNRRRVLETASQARSIESETGHNAIRDGRCGNLSPFEIDSVQILQLHNPPTS